MYVFLGWVDLHYMCGIQSMESVVGLWVFTYGGTDNKSVGDIPNVVTEVGR